MLTHHFDFDYITLAQSLLINSAGIEWFNILLYTMAELKIVKEELKIVKAQMKKVCVLYTDILI